MPYENYIADLYLDLESVPCQRPGIREELAQTITPPGNYKKQETIDKWMAEEAPAKIEEAYRRTALQGHLGEIICICYAVDDRPVNFVWRDLGESEADMLTNFWASLRGDGVHQVRTWIGHNLRDFDLRYLYQRSVIHQVRPSIREFPPERPQDTFDTMTQWAGYRGTISLHDLTQALGIPTPKGDLDGSKVWDYVQAGRISEVVEYCAADVEAVREIHKRLTFTTSAKSTPVGAPA